jgi:uncharacterized protein YndB with AHSA1/START domain
MNDTDAVVIERIFSAPPEVVWRMWTDPTHFSQWYGPDGMSIPVAEMDVRPGGARRICMEMQTPDGPFQMWFTGEYRQVTENVRLIYTESMSDEAGNIAETPDGGHATTEVRVELEGVEGGTRVVMTHLGIPSDSPGAAGWTMAFDKLATLLDTRPNQ